MLKTKYYKNAYELRKINYKLTEKSEKLKFFRNHKASLKRYTWIFRLKFLPVLSILVAKTNLNITQSFTVEFVSFNSGTFLI